jgi:anti-sigma regulatory factor (Ser/Thr protein kinase)
MNADGPQSQSTTLELVCPSCTDILQLVRSVVATVCREIGFSPDDATLIEVSVDEACTNVVRHAYDDPPEAGPDEAVLRVQVQPGADRLAIRVIDAGTGVPPEGFQSVSSPEEYMALAKPSGLGLFIINRFMDEVALESPTGSGTVLSMVKYLGCSRKA